MRKTFLPVLIFLISSPLALATEQSELDQAMRQLDAAQQALARAHTAANSSKAKERIYFDYAQARRDIDLVKAGIARYINSNRAQPRDPRQIRTLSGEYDKVRAK